MPVPMVTVNQLPMNSQHGDATAFFVMRLTKEK